MSKNSKYNVIDLFSGIGGFSKGFEKAGFDIKLGIDNWPIALETFKHNHKNSKTLTVDLTKLPDSFYKQLGYKVDVIIAGPPCQGFSMAGKRNEDDMRNKLFSEVIRAAKLTKPRVVIIENVVGLASMKTVDGESVKDRLIQSLVDIGYKVKFTILTASDYGVPQKRRRVLFVGYLVSGTEYEFPDPENETITVGDALGNLPDTDKVKVSTPISNFQKYLCEYSSKKIFNHVPMNHSKTVQDRINHVPEGGNWRDVPPKYYQVKGNHSNNYRRLTRDKPSITIKHATKSMIIHPTYNRVITAREAARLQSFPDDFLLFGTTFEQHQQLANAVPPLLGFAIAKSTKKYLNETIKI